MVRVERKEEKGYDNDFYFHKTEPMAILYVFRSRVWI